jgi:hypothetical protein
MWGDDLSPLRSPRHRRALASKGGRLRGVPLSRDVDRDLMAVESRGNERPIFQLRTCRASITRHKITNCRQLPSAVRAIPLHPSDDAVNRRSLA